MNPRELAARPALTACLLTLALSSPGHAADWADPASLPPPPARAIGFPSRAPDLDALPGFRNPPPGYGEVAFFWWLGDPLTKERLTWELDQLAAHHVSGLQINYAHTDRGGRSYGLTFPSDPPLFSEAWWELFRWFLGECRKRGMAASLSDYTLCTPGQGWWTDEIIRERPDLRGALLANATRDVTGGTELRWEVPPDLLDLRAFPRSAKSPGDAASPIDLRSSLEGRNLRWQAPAGDWQVVAVHRQPVPLSIDPMHPESGANYLAKFFQRFADRNPGETGAGLNFFFSDELDLGVGGRLWNDRFAAEFRRRKGYDLTSELATLFTDTGPRTPKVRLDYSDVVVALSEEGFFRPIFEWHRSRGMVFGCDHGGRGRNVVEFGDYFRTQRWMTGPGNDSPVLSADVVKNKVASSIAHLYQRPRTWLEGYHSSGWGTTSAQVTDATFRNFISGHNLLTLHGLYYSTHGGFWEWAPPCNHFRLPYWNHFRELLGCSERLSYLLSQGVHHCDVAILYPVAPMEAGLGGDEAVRTAFQIGPDLFNQGIDFDYLDFESLARAELGNGTLDVSGESYRVLILPAMRALRWSTLERALAFHRAGGIVLAVGALPEASDRAGRDDPQLDAAVRELFGTTARETSRIPNPRPAAGASRWLSSVERTPAVVDALLPGDFARRGPDGKRLPTQVLHRRVGPRDVYMVLGAPRGSECTFQTRGAAELWDPWTGSVRPLFETLSGPEATRVRMPLGSGEAQLIVFRPNRSEPKVEGTDLDEITAVVADESGVRVEGLSARAGSHHAMVRSGDRIVALRAEVNAVPKTMALDDAWEFELSPTLDNRWGDFRIPATPGRLGAEARRFRQALDLPADVHPEKPGFDDSGWRETTASFGLQFWKLGPVPDDAPLSELESRFAAARTIDPAAPVDVGGRSLRWEPYDFSWRWGPEGDPGHQGWHGLKEFVSDDFLITGASRWADREFVYQKEPGGSHYYFWTTVTAPEALDAQASVGGARPAAIWLNGTRLDPGAKSQRVVAGANPLLIRYDGPGRGHVAFLRADRPEPATRADLAMRWYRNPAVLPFDARPSREPHVGWYRFTAPPGLRGFTMLGLGELRAWIDGREAKVTTNARPTDGPAEYRVTPDTTREDPVLVALRLELRPGTYGAAAIPGEIALDCGPGRLAPGDWSKVGTLASYSGGAWYRRRITVDAEQAQGRTTLDLGDVRASAEVRVNGLPAGIRVAPPFRFDLSRQLRPGENTIEVLVCNTLANHYTTIPTRYRGDTTSGLLGPVRLETRVPVTLREQK